LKRKFRATAILRSAWEAVPCGRSGTQFSTTLAFLLFTIFAFHAAAQSPLVLDHNGSTIALEPYAPNIIRVTLSLQKDQALVAPGFGFIAQPAAEGWSHQHTDAADIYQSSRMIVRVDASHPGGTLPRTIRDISKYFNGSTPGAHITITTPAGV
jgi:alpha-D-xyloside xylohydrolase